MIFGFPDDACGRVRRHSGDNGGTIATLAGTRLVVAMVSIVMLAACSSPGKQHRSLARDQGYAVMDVAAAQHTLTAYLPEARTAGPDARWHIYLTGDGTPWIAGRRPSADPTPRRDMILRLAAHDPAPHLVLHRPCYARDELNAPCRPTLWTGSRYSEDVVTAMDTALNRLVEQRAIGEIVLIGYSGGGTLARLLAARRDDVAALVTIAANLDHAAWTEHHGYRPLDGSLHVGSTPTLRADYPQWHLIGGRDAVVPPEVTRSGLQRDPGALIMLYPQHDHACCWVDDWPGLLAALDRVLKSPSASSPGVNRQDAH